MNQSGYIAAALLGAFVLFLAAKRRLGVYASALWGATSVPEQEREVGSLSPLQNPLDIIGGVKIPLPIPGVPPISVPPINDIWDVINPWDKKS